MYCESRMYNVNHLNRNGTTDHGIWQINDIHKKNMADLGLNIYKSEDTLEYGFILMKREGTKPWSASKSCWSKWIALREWGESSSFSPSADTGLFFKEYHEARLSTRLPCWASQSRRSFSGRPKWQSLPTISKSVHTAIKRPFTGKRRPRDMC